MCDAGQCLPKDTKDEYYARVLEESFKKLQNSFSSTSSSLTLEGVKNLITKLTAHLTVTDGKQTEPLPTDQCINFVKSIRFFIGESPESLNEISQMEQYDLLCKFLLKELVDCRDEKKNLKRQCYALFFLMMNNSKQPLVFQKLIIPTLVQKLYEGIVKDTIRIDEAKKKVFEEGIDGLLFLTGSHVDYAFYIVEGGTLSVLAQTFVFQETTREIRGWTTNPPKPNREGRIVLRHHDILEKVLHLIDSLAKSAKLMDISELKTFKDFMQEVNEAERKNNQSRRSILQSYAESILDKIAKGF